jgi:hypothetical protein
MRTKTIEKSQRKGEGIMQHDELAGMIKEFHRSSIDRFNKIEEKLDSLNSFRWHILGGSAVMSVVVAVGIQFFIGRR